LTSAAGLRCPRPFTLGGELHEENDDSGRGDGHDDARRRLTRRGLGSIVFATRRASSDLCRYHQRHLRDADVRHHVGHEQLRRSSTSRSTNWISLTPQNAFDRHVSWEFRLGSERIDDAGCNCYVFHAQFGGGVTFASADQRAAIFFLANTHVWSGMHLDGLFHAPIRIGLGPEGGLRLRILPNLIALFIGEWDWLPVQHPLAAWNATATIRWAATHVFALDLTGQYDERTGTGVLSTLFYF
jgi:hypothetical protein